MKLARIRRAEKSLKIDVQLKTLTSDGVVFYAAQKEDGSGDYVALVLNDGFIEFRFELGSGPVVMRSDHRLTNSFFHRVVASREGRNASLQVDGRTVGTRFSPGDMISLNLQTPTYLGAVPDTPER